MPTREEIRAAALRVLGGIAPEADLASIPPEANLRRELDLDSIDFQNFLIGLSKALHVDIPERDAARLTTLAACFEHFGRSSSAAAPG
jgi:acyl carrier protein